MTIVFKMSQEPEPKKIKRCPFCGSDSMQPVENNAEGLRCVECLEYFG